MEREDEATQAAATAKDEQITLLKAVVCTCIPLVQALHSHVTSFSGVI